MLTEAHYDEYYQDKAIDKIMSELEKNDTKVIEQSQLQQTINTLCSEIESVKSLVPNDTSINMLNYTKCSKFANVSDFESIVFSNQETIFKDEFSKSKKLQYLEYKDEKTNEKRVKVLVPNTQENIIDIVTYYSIKSELRDFKLYDLR